MTSAAELANRGVYVSLGDLAGLEHRVRRFSFLPRQPVKSVLNGRHASRMRGRGLNFEEIRGYLAGDDIRSIDWKVTARIGEPHVRVFTEERERPALILVDQRQNMFFGTRLNMKSVTAAELGALAAWRILSVGDRVGGLVFTDTDFDEIKPHRSRGAVNRFLETLVQRNRALNAEADIHAGAPSQLNGALDWAGRIAGHDWLIVVISDFDGADERTRRAVARLSVHNDVVLAIVHDPAAMEVPKSGRLVAGDGVLQVELDLADRQVRDNLEAVGGGRIRKLLEWQRELMIPVLPISAGEETAPQLSALMGLAPRRRR